MFAELSRQNDLLKEGALPKATRPSQRRDMAAEAVVRKGVSIALACPTLGISERFYRYETKLKVRASGSATG